MPAKKSKTKKQPVKKVEKNDDSVMHKLLDQKIEIPVGLLRQKHIFIATPCYGGQIGEPYFRSMMRLAILFSKYDIPYTTSNNTDASANFILPFTCSIHTQADINVHTNIHIDEIEPFLAITDRYAPKNPVAARNIISNVVFIYEFLWIR